MIGFAESAEYVDRTGTTAATDINEARINRLYQAFFLRAPDAAGLSYWAGQAESGVALETIAAAFAGSDEFQNQYGELSNQAFVSLVYNNVLNRPADTDGLNYWSGQLNAGLDRGTVMVGFSESARPGNGRSRVGRFARLAQWFRPVLLPTCQRPKWTSRQVW
jgi:hypothetical protein